MRLFKCQNCGQIVYFENTACERCGHRLGFLSDPMTITALTPKGDLWQPLRSRKTLRFCANAAHDACNWLVAPDAASPLCVACQHNRTIPDLGVPENLLAWQKLEIAKHRLFYALLRLGLQVTNRVEDPEGGLAFDFLADPPADDAPKVMTGHDNGLITIALAEADDAERERRRTQMHEPYRSLLGHFRHEVGHYFWDVLIRDGGKLEECRAVFGDDSQDYGAALQAHYQNGPPPDWQANYVSAYATSHPWEDWAETWAHYLHIIDTVEMASAFGIRVQPRLAADDALAAEIDIDPYRSETFDPIIEAWVPLTLAVNSLNRAMGSPDLYPFVLSPGVVAKLRFVHDVVHAARGRTRAAPQAVKETAPPAGA
ncbi:MAG: hypothetical protein BGO51_20200 [Rhodospirillales bacterium 69-11]|nr:putative zinc-binding peptidase [Rhodospirillales bacterium]OJW27708.1 MAG: hypothetical protein BGO51_20200 [Rhodospirillales bacterium 69-11]